jgi:NAD(P)-dependent dehydrogenase (short-subunit alcohol dehydrogenase family)
VLSELARALRLTTDERAQLFDLAGVGTAVPALRERPDEFRRVIDVDLMGAYWMAQAAARVMPPGSSIVNIASVLGLVKSLAPQAEALRWC